MGYAILSSVLGVENSWTPTFTGFSSAPTGVTASYMFLTSKLYWFRLWMNSATTSNATTMTFTLPFSTQIANPQPSIIIATVTNNGTTGTGPGRGLLSQNSNVVTCFTNSSNGAWTSSGDKRIFCEGFIVIE